MIRSFADKGSRDIYLGENTKRARKICPVYLHQKARMKLVMIDRAHELVDLKQPGNDFKKIGDQFQIRINRQYRIRFEWQNTAAEYVTVGEFHDN